MKDTDKKNTDKKDTDKKDTDKKDTDKKDTDKKDKDIKDKDIKDTDMKDTDKKDKDKKDKDKKDKDIKDKDIINFKNILKIDNKNCQFYLKKNGKIIYHPINKNNNYLCILNHNLNMVSNYFPLLNGKNEIEILQKLIIFKHLQNNDTKYFILKEKNKTKNILICTFKEENIEKFITLFYYTTNTKKILNYNYLNINECLAYSYVIKKLLFKKILKDKIFIKLFYEDYIHLIKHKIYNKYKITFNNFSNFNKLYLFLKDKGYVDKYYNGITNKIVKISKKIEKKFLSNNLDYQKFKKRKLKLIKNYKDIDLFELIDNHLNKKFDKTSIKNKFIAICKKYNI